MSNTQTREPNHFYKQPNGSYVGSFISLQFELHDLILTFYRTSRNSNEVWSLSTVSPRTGVLFPIGTATLMQPEAEGEGPYFLGKIEDPSGIIPFKIAPADPNEPDGAWIIRYNPPMNAANNAQMQQGGFQRQQRRGFSSQRSTALGPSTGVGGFPQANFGGGSGHGFNAGAPNGFTGNEGTQGDEIPY